MSMKFKDVYLEAARRVAENEIEYSCHAVAKVVGPKRYDNTCYENMHPVQRYCRVFSTCGRYIGFCAEIVKACSIFNRRNYIEERNLRVMLLCLMAECWKDFK